MKNKEITERSLLADRIQCSCSIKYLLNTKEYQYDSLAYYQPVFDYYWCNKKEFKVRYDKDKKQYYIEVPEEIYLLKFPYFSHVRIRTNNPFTVTAEFNFIRYLRHFALYQECDEEGLPVGSENYAREYDLSIRVADDNYIDPKVWKTWDSGLIKDLSVFIPDLCKQLATFIVKEYVEDFDLPYEVLTVKEIEFNQDYFVGYHKSSEVLHQLKYFLISSSGVEWINKLSALSISVYSCKKSSPETRFYGDPYSPTIRFNVGKGIYFKIYRKTTDHIRFEVTYTKEYIKRKFGKESYAFVYEPLRAIAKSFFKKADFENIILSAIDNSYSDNFSLYDNFCKFVSEVKPKLMGVADAVIYGNPVYDYDLQHYIHSDKDLNRCFVCNYVKDSKVLVYDPVLANSLRKHNRNLLLNVEDKKLFLHRLWRDLKDNPDSDKKQPYLKHDLTGFVWK